MSRSHEVHNGHVDRRSLLKAVGVVGVAGIVDSSIRYLRACANRHGIVEKLEHSFSFFPGAALGEYPVSVGYLDVSSPIAWYLAELQTPLVTNSARLAYRSFEESLCVNIYACSDQ
jgi:hypothetical protein